MQAALYDACYVGDMGTATALLMKGADPNLADARGSTCLHVACAKGHESTVTALLAKGADTNIADNAGGTALHFAGGHVNIVTLLLGKSAESQADARGQTPLHAASLNGHTALAALLLTGKGTNPNQGDARGQTALHLCCEMGHNDVAQLLLAHHANPNQAEAHGQTPLHLACFKGHVATAKLLLEKGSDPNKATPSGYTPLRVGCNKGFASIVTLLLSNGADPLAGSHIPSGPARCALLVTAHLAKTKAARTAHVPFPAPALRASSEKSVLPPTRMSKILPSLRKMTSFSPSLGNVASNSASLSSKVSSRLHSLDRARPGRKKQPDMERRSASVDPPLKKMTVGFDALPEESSSSNGPRRLRSIKSQPPLDLGRFRKQLGRDLNLS